MLTMTLPPEPPDDNARAVRRAHAARCAVQGCYFESPAADRCLYCAQPRGGPIAGRRPRPECVDQEASALEIKLARGQQQLAEMFALIAELERRRDLHRPPDDAPRC
jgi:hypothetical protein